MRNRAKCKLCEDIIESHHTHDYVSCKCGEISVDGGNSYWRCRASSWDNFLRVDDDDNIIIPEIKDPEPIKKPEKTSEIIQQEEIDKKKLVKDAVKSMIETYENLPDHAKHSFVTNQDLCSVLLLLSCALDCADDI